MELQWPLILFTTLLSASCGLFAVQGLYATRGEAKEAQMPALITSLVLLVVSGIAVFFHLQHWERIFNGFGHITSGITQELIFIVIMFVVMVVFFALIRRNGEPSKGAGWAAVIVACLLVLVAGHSYMMPSRPAWDTVLGPLSLLGAGFAAGAGLFPLSAACKGVDLQQKFTGALALTGTAVNALFTCVYIGCMAAAGSGFASMGYTFDPVHPTYALKTAAAYSPFASGAMAPTICAIVCALAALVVAIVARKRSNWKVAGALIAVLAVASALALRVTFYLCGGDVFMLY